MLHASTQKLIIKLCELTEAGQIAWKQGDGQCCRFETEGYVVEVEGRPPTLRLLQSDGRELERADEPELAAQPWPSGEGTFAAQVVLLAARAHRVARGAEHAISRILSSLSAPPKSAPLDFEPAPVAAAEPAPPPAPHTVPGPPPNLVVSDTAIDRVLAVEPSPAAAPAPEPEPVIIESETAAFVGDPETVETVVAEAASEDAEPSPPEPAAPAPEPVVIEAEAVAIVAPTPPSEPQRPAPQQTVQAPVAKPAPRPDAFGATPSFAMRRDSSATPDTPRVASPKPFSTSPLFFGVNQMPRAPVRAEPEPPPVPAPTAKPVTPPAPVAANKAEPAVTGPDIYKPWS